MAPTLKTIRFIFPEALNEEQENILIVNLKELKRRAIEAVKNGMKDFDRREVRAVMGDSVEIQKARFGILVNLMETKFALTKDGTAYSFIYPEEDVTGLSFKALGREIKLARVMPEKRIIRFIKENVCKDMGVDGRKVMYEVEEEPLKDLAANP